MTHLYFSPHRSQLNSIKFPPRPIKCTTLQSERSVLLHVFKSMYYYVIITFSLMFSVFVVTSATKPPKSMSYKYQKHLFGSGSMKGKLLPVSFPNNNYEPIVEYKHFINIFILLFTNSPPEVKLMKKGDGYVLFTLFT